MRFSSIINIFLISSPVICNFNQQSFESEAEDFFKTLNKTFKSEDLNPILDEIMNSGLESIPLEDMPLIKPNIQDIIDLLPLAIPLVGPYVGHKTAQQLVNYGQMSLELTNQLSQLPEFQTWFELNYKKFKNYQQIVLKLELNKEDNEEVPMRMPVKYALAETLTSKKTKKFVQTIMKKAFVIQN